MEPIKNNVKFSIFEHAAFLVDFIFCIVIIINMSNTNDNGGKKKKLMSYAKCKKKNEAYDATID